MFIIASLCIILNLYSATATECVLGPITSFYDCAYYCIQKYGKQPKTQRMFYNKNTGFCQKEVDCGNHGFHRIYENRCMQAFQYTEIDNVLVAIPEDFQVIHKIFIHGNPYAKTQQKMCYPGYKSSYKRVEISKQVYQEYYCDIKIGQNPQKYPDSLGEYYFWLLRQNQQRQAVISAIQQEQILSWQYTVIVVMQIYIFLALLHRHYKLCRSSRRKVKKNVQKKDIENN